MVTHDRIRLIGLLRESPAFAGLSYSNRARVHHRCITRFADRPPLDVLLSWAELVRHRMVERNLGDGESAPGSSERRLLIEQDDPAEPPSKEGRPCGARRTEWVVRTRREARLQLVPLQTCRGFSAALSLLVSSERFGKWIEKLASHALRKRGMGAAPQHHGPAKLAPLLVRFGESSPDGPEE